jgi:hypothetical protein
MRLVWRETFLTIKQTGMHLALFDYDSWAAEGEEGVLR